MPNPVPLLISRVLMNLVKVLELVYITPPHPSDRNYTRQGCKLRRWDNLYLAKVLILFKLLEIIARMLQSKGSHFDS